MGPRCGSTSSPQVRIWTFNVQCKHGYLWEMLYVMAMHYWPDFQLVMRVH